MEKFILSVIVPVYNVEKYLRKCVDSVLAQEIAGMEVIEYSKKYTPLKEKLYVRLSSPARAT